MREKSFSRKRQRKSKTRLVKVQKEIQIEIDGFTFNTIYSVSSRTALPVLALHGFTGRASDLSFLAEFLPENFILVAPDLPGHGTSQPVENIEDYEIDKIVKRLALLLQALEFEKAVLLGYSMGGRIAYSFAAQFPEKVAALIIESSTPGIRNETEREKRVLQDNALAEKILRDGVFKFVEYWLSLPLFASLKNMDARLYEKLRAEKISNNALGLANSLRATGTGKMPPVWDKLPAFDFSVLLINGALDEKYSAIHKEAEKNIPNAKRVEIIGAGHNVHTEKPHEFLAEVISFLNETFTAKP